MKVARAAMLSDRGIKMCAFFVDETTCCVRRAFILRPCSVCSLSGNMDFYSLAAAHRKDAGIGEKMQTQQENSRHKRMQRRRAFKND